MSEESKISRVGWGHGLWQYEPDRKQWRDPDTRFPCLALRNPELGAWCVYVGVPPDHPLHGRELSDEDSQECASLARQLEEARSWLDEGDEI